jgi:hypothetical protein
VQLVASGPPSRTERQPGERVCLHIALSDVRSRCSPRERARPVPFIVVLRGRAHTQGWAASHREGRSVPVGGARPRPRATRGSWTPLTWSPVQPRRERISYPGGTPLWGASGAPTRAGARCLGARPAAPWRCLAIDPSAAGWPRPRVTRPRRAPCARPGARRRRCSGEADQPRRSGVLRVRDSSCGRHVDASLRANVAGVRSDSVRALPGPYHRAVGGAQGVGSDSALSVPATTAWATSLSFWLLLRA